MSSRYKVGDMVAIPTRDVQYEGKKREFTKINLPTGTVRTIKIPYNSKGCDMYRSVSVIRGKITKITKEKNRKGNIVDRYFVRLLLGYEGKNDKKPGPRANSYSVRQIRKYPKTNYGD